MSSHRHVTEGYQEWLQRVPWQLFCIFTFAWPVSDMQAIGVFHEFIDRLEKRIRGPITYVRGDEKRFSGCGMPGAPRHFHVLLAAHRRLDRQWVAQQWMALAGRRKNGAGADARVYDASLGGVAYLLKFINQPQGDWDLGNVDLYLRTPGSASHSRQRRRLARHGERLETVGDRS
jgi:hypothetical protein